ncbi:GNAT family N-acetyltransferase [Solirubrobacter soli]|uniref:GNAT family N-acetyltransferase n=1 Tax=Solirubrobacter soli TaxID=363832 RepID=UPI000422C603|nr:GNAT family N-acetyltransferase [Solirubrobacter soli]
MELENIDAERTVLVALRASDADELAGLLDEAQLREWLRAQDLDELRDRFAGWETRRSPDGDEQWLNWIVRERGDGRAVGWVQATVRGASASVAYALLPAERGAGAASDAVRALVRWLRDRLAVTVVTAEIDESNAASARVAVAAGFERTIRRSGDEVVWEHRTTH